MSSRVTAIGFVALSVLSGGVLWWGLSRSQTPPPPTNTTSSAPSDPSLAYKERGLLPYEINTINVVREASPGVVFVSVSNGQLNASSSSSQVPPGFGFLAPFFQQEQPSGDTGSGFVISRKGFIVTNYHVIALALQTHGQVTVRFPGDPHDYPAKIWGTAHALDLALLKVDVPAKLLHPLILGNSDNVLVGEKAIAIGNPFGFSSTVTQGIVSAVRQNPGAAGSGGFIPSVIQTDAAINPGNSGGPLLNSRGHVIGINTSIVSPSAQSSGMAQFAGIGFAIPINVLKQYLPELEAGKTITSNDLANMQPHIGVEVIDMKDYPSQILQQYHLPDYGLMIQKVLPNTPAARAGLRGPTKTAYIQNPDGSYTPLGLNGDIILKANGQRINGITDFRSVLDSLQPGQAVQLEIWRNGHTFTIDIVPIKGREQ
jgi:serine protease Do